MTKRRANYCPYCGTELGRRTFEGRERTFCPACGEFVFQNPVPGGAVVVLDGPDVLFVKRGHEPDRGTWAIPGGVFEVDESAPVGAARELAEETGLRVDPDDLELVRTGFDVEDPADGSYLSICFAVEHQRTRGRVEVGEEPDAVRFWNPEALVESEAAETRPVAVERVAAAFARLRDEERHFGTNSGR